MTRNTGKLINEFSKTPSYKISISKSIAFLHTVHGKSNIKPENSIIYNALKSMKYLETNLMRDMRMLHLLLLNSKKLPWQVKDQN